MTEPAEDILDELIARLGRTLGPDLADTLVHAARSRGDLTLDMQLAINDGLDSLTPDQRAEVLSILDDLRRRLADSETEADQ